MDLRQPTADSGPRLPPLLPVLFAGSGAAALIYELVWFQQLQLSIGSSAASLAVLLGTFMGGLCLGNLGLPRLVAATRHPLRVYAALECALGLAGLLVLVALPAAGRVYVGWLGRGHPGLLVRALVCAACLLPPTALMGATLPALARWVETTPRGVSRLGFLYASNIAGAVAGCLLAGFYLLPVHDTFFAANCAAAVNFGVALVALGLAAFSPRPSAPPTALVPPPRPIVVPPGILVVIALSGFCALAAEVIWTRLLSLLLGATVYAFSVILAVFLGGLALGSFAGAALVRRTPRPRTVLGACQLLQVLAIGWAADMLTRTLPFWPVAYSAGGDHWLRSPFDLLRCAVAILPAAGLWGASFPLALAAGAAPGQDPARSVGRLAAANTLGAIAGAALTSLVLLPALGTARVEGLLIVLSVAGALVVLRPARIRSRLAVAAAVALALWIGATSPGVPWQLVCYGAYALAGDQTARVLYLGEGENATVAVSEARDGTKYFHVSGKTEASSSRKDMRLQRMLGHLPALLQPEPRSVLVIGCGAGVTAGTFVSYPSVQRIVICEIEPLIPEQVAPLFRPENAGVLSDPRVELVADDARHYLATTPEKFDVITADPIHPWVKGAAMLYTAEYFDLCRQHLRAGGLLAQWVPFYNSSRAAVQSELATFFSVFPDGTVWGNDDEGRGYDVVLLAPARPLTIDLTAIGQRLGRPDYAAVRRSLAEVGFDSADGLLSTYAGRGSDLAGWLAQAELNRDRNLRLQYTAGRSRNSREGRIAYVEMLALRRFPEGLFRGTDSAIAHLRAAIESRGGPSPPPN